MKTAKIHYEYWNPACGCGDSFCGECASREGDDVIACGVRRIRGVERTKNTSEVTCSKCKSKKKFKADEVLASRARAPRTHTVEIVSGVEGLSVYLNGYRIAGEKPWGGGTIAKRFIVSQEDLEIARKRQ